MSMDTLWARRTKLSSNGSLNGANSIATTTLDGSNRGSLLSKRNGPDTSSFSKKSLSSLSPGNITTSSAAFGLGSGAFASFGSAKTPKSPFDATLGSYGAKSLTAERPLDDAVNKSGASRPTAISVSASTELVAGKSSRAPNPAISRTLRDSWSFWFRPPISKAHGFVDYEKTLHGIASVETVEDFFTVYRHLKRPSTLPPVSDYHLFKGGIRPIWEDDENKKGGKWVVRLKKGVADRLWEDLLFALIGDQFGDASEDVCGAVLSVRSGEDTLSIWTKTAGGRVLKIRETMRHVLAFPPATRVEFKSHDSSMQQVTAMEESRREKNTHHQTGEKRANAAMASKSSSQDKGTLGAA